MTGHRSRKALLATAIGTLAVSCIVAAAIAHSNLNEQKQPAEPPTLEAARAQVAAAYGRLGSEPPPVNGDDLRLCAFYAREFEKRGWLHRAIGEWDLVIAGSPGDSDEALDAMRVKARALARLGDYGAAHQVLDQLEKQSERSVRKDAIGKPQSFRVATIVCKAKARLYLETDQYELAAAAWERGRQLYLSPPSAAARSFVLAHKEDFACAAHVDYAVAIAATWRRSGAPDKALAYYREAMSYLADHDVTTGSDAIQGVSYTQDRIYTVPVGMAEALMLKQDFSGALRELNSVAAAMGTESAQRQFVPQAPGKVSQMESAVFAYLRDVDLPMRIARCLIALGQCEAAVLRLTHAQSALADAALFSQVVIRAESRPIRTDDTEAVGSKELKELRDKTIPMMIADCEKRVGKG